MFKEVARDVCSSIAHRTSHATYQKKLSSTNDTRRTSHVSLRTCHVARHTSLQVAAEVCSRVAALSGPHGVVSDAVEYTSDGWSVNLAMSSAGIFTALPVSLSLFSAASEAARHFINNLFLYCLLDTLVSAEHRVRRVLLEMQASAVRRGRC